MIQAACSGRLQTFLSSVLPQLLVRHARPPSVRPSGLPANTHRHVRQPRNMNVRSREGLSRHCVMDGCNVTCFTLDLDVMLSREVYDVMYQMLKTTDSNNQKHTHTLTSRESKACRHHPHPDRKVSSRRHHFLLSLAPPGVCKSHQTGLD